MNRLRRNVAKVVYAAINALWAIATKVDVPKSPPEKHQSLTYEALATMTVDDLDARLDFIAAQQRQDMRDVIKRIMA